MYNRKDYERFEFLHKKLFIITNLEQGRLHNKTSKHEDRVTTIAASVTGVYMLIGLFTFKEIGELTGLGPIGAIILIAILDLITIYYVVLHVQYHVNERVRERTLSDTGNIKFDLSKVWKISPGGIRENVKIYQGTTVAIRYTSNAVILRGVMRGVIDCESDMDKKHYAALQKLVDMCMREGYELNTINLPYNIDNDPLWDSESEKIYRSSADLGNDYTMLMTTLHNHIYEFTQKNSRVTVTYYILKGKPGVLVQPELLATEIQKLNNHCQLNLTGIDMKEFKNLLEGYYGINISIEDITNFMTITSTDIGESKIISYIDSEGNLVKMGKIFEYNIPSIFTTFDFEQQPMRIEDKEDDTMVEVEEDTTIFDQDII